MESFMAETEVKMSNVIKRNTVFIECMVLVDNNLFAAEEVIGNYKHNDMWIVNDSNGKKWRNLTNNLRNENYFKFINQYTMMDIVYYLMSRDENYQTVLTEMLVDAIEKTFDEAWICCIEDIYKYISENLI